MSDRGDDGDALGNSDARFRLAVETLGESRLGRALGRYRPAAASAAPAAKK